VGVEEALPVVVAYGLGLLPAAGLATRDSPWTAKKVA